MWAEDTRSLLPKENDILHSLTAIDVKNDLCFVLRKIKETLILE